MCCNVGFFILFDCLGVDDQVCIIQQTKKKIKNNKKVKHSKQQELKELDILSLFFL